MNQKFIYNGYTYVLPTQKLHHKIKFLMWKITLKKRKIFEIYIKWNIIHFIRAFLFICYIKYIKKFYNETVYSYTEYYDLYENIINCKKGLKYSSNAMMIVLPHKCQKLKKYIN